MCCRLQMQEWAKHPSVRIRVWIKILFSICSFCGLTKMIFYLLRSECSCKLLPGIGCTIVFFNVSTCCTLWRTLGNKLEQKKKKNLNSTTLAKPRHDAGGRAQWSCGVRNGIVLLVSRQQLSSLPGLLCLFAPSLRRSSAPRMDSRQKGTHNEGCVRHRLQSCCFESHCIRLCLKQPKETFRRAAHCRCLLKQSRPPAEEATTGHTELCSNGWDILCTLR